MGNRIRVVREAVGLTQKRLGEALGVDQAQLSRWETGQQQVSAKIALAMGRALGVSVEELGLEGVAGYPNRIGELRQQLGLTLADLAGRVGVTPAALSLIESGHLQTFTSTALGLARELGVGVEDLGLKPDRAQAS